MIFNKHGCVHIAIPKTGTFLRTALIKGINPSSAVGLISKKSNYGRLIDFKGGLDHPSYNFEVHGHFTISQWRREVAKRHQQDHAINNYVTFAFVRNPYDRFVSLWKTYGSEESISKFFRRKDWIQSKAGTQTEFIVDSTGNVAVDFVGKVEEIESDWEKLRKLVPSLPRYNSSYNCINNDLNEEKDYMKYYSRSMKNLVYKRYKKDFINLGYDNEL